MTTEVKRVAETILVTEVSQVVVSDITTAQDGTSIRSIRVWGSDGASGFPVLELQLDSSDLTAIKLTTPEIKF